MSALRQAAHDYIEMRRGLGFKLREAGRGLIDFVSFLEANDAPYITMELALIGSPPIRGHKFRLTGCCLFARSGRYPIFTPMPTSGVFCPPHLRCRADTPAASSGR